MMTLRTLASAVALAATATVGAAAAHAAAAPAQAAAHPAAARAAAPAAAHAAAPAAAPAKAAASGSTAATPDVRVVRPGQLVSVGHGQYLKLTRTERCVGTPPDWSTCKSVVDGNQPAGTVSLQSSGDASGTLYSPLYIGAGRAARVTVTTGGVTYEAQVVTLAGHPGYATAYVWGPPTTEFPGERPEVTVYDAAGTVLAHM
jgi:hypothetical protein